MLRAIRPWTATWSFLRAIAIIALLSSSVAPSALAKSVLPDDINSSGYVLLIRHAYAPGNGDPDDFKLRNCSTQRNLNQQGREQALKIGEFLKAQNVIAPEVYSSQWCRCLETAKHMDIAPVIELSGLNSFYDYPEQKEPNMRNLRAFLAKRPTSGPLTILVTHFVTIAELVDVGVSSGEGVLISSRANGSKVVSRLDFGFAL